MGPDEGEHGDEYRHGCDDGQCDATGATGVGAHRLQPGSRPGPAAIRHPTETGVDVLVGVVAGAGIGGLGPKTESAMQGGHRLLVSHAATVGPGHDAATAAAARCGGGCGPIRVCECAGVPTVCP